MMRADARDLALALMREHGLMTPDDGAPWSFGFDAARRRLGRCNYGRRLITLSGPNVDVNDVPVIRNTILHEVAHALAPIGAGHGPRWRIVARAIGAEPVACATDAVSAPAPFYLICESCGYRVARYRKGTRTFTHTRDDGRMILQRAAI